MLGNPNKLLRVKLQLHKRFFACNGDAIFWKIVTSSARGENHMCSHSHTGDATHEKIAEKNREKFQELNCCDKIKVFVRGWLHLRFLPSICNNFKKNASPSQAKNRLCSRGFKYSTMDYHPIQGGVVIHQVISFNRNQI